MSPAARRSLVTGTLSLPRKDSQFWVNTSSAWSGVSMPFIASQGIWPRCASFHQAACSFATSLMTSSDSSTEPPAESRLRIQLRSSRSSSDAPLSIWTFAEIAPRRADRAVSGELAVEPDLALVEPHRVHGRARFPVRGRERRHQRRWCTRLRLVVADLQSSDLPGESKLANGRGLDRCHPRLIRAPAWC